MLCKFCDALSVSGLIELAEIEFSAHNFPQKAYYQHHASYSDLVSSAKSACELCEIIHQGFNEVVVDGGYWDEYTLHEAIRMVQAGGLSTDLKICINTSHLYAEETLESVKLFDSLYVQAGAPVPIGDKVYYEEEPEPWSVTYPLNYMILDLSVPREKSRSVGNYEVGRYHTDPDLGSSQNHAIAKGWLETCCARLEEEARCTQCSKLPTRVIDVGKLSRLQDPRIFLSGMTEGRYAALSHCWGGPISPLLTTGNLESFQECIPYRDLPANFRDAISITRQLGIQYLWIDSLCIIQNSRTDWEIESKKMGSIYRDALLTISASTSPGSTHGIVKSDPLLKENRQNFHLKVYPSSNEQHVNLNLSGLANFSNQSKKPENLYNLFADCPLSQRGWTLQEGLLSPRILYYGDRQIYWKCPHGFQSADGMPSTEGGGVMPPDTLAFPKITAIFHKHLRGHPQTEPANRDAILQDYYWLVCAYSSRRLTYESDKLPAFSGIAELLHPTIGGEYLAGLWSTDLVNGLSWFDEMGFCMHVKSYRAPSWAWAVTDDPVVFYPFNNEPTFSDAHDVSMVSGNVQSKSGNPYGQVESGQLVLKGWTRALVRSPQQIWDSAGMSMASIHYDEAEGEIGRHASAHLFQRNSNNRDYFFSMHAGEPGEATPATENIEVDNDKISEIKYSILLLKTLLDDDHDQFITSIGLVLRKVGGGEDEKYERVGFVTFYPIHSNTFQSWIMGWVEETIVLV